MIDMRTVILSYVISNAICAIVVAFLWFDNRRRFAGLGFWLADFAMQFTALLLSVMRGNLPDLLTMTLSNTLAVGGTVLLFIGLEHFIGKRSSQTHNIILLVIFICVHAWFTILDPSLDARNIILSLGLLIICSQCAWLLLWRVDADMRPITRTAGMIMAAYCIASVVRIVVDMAVPNDENFFHSNAYDTSLVMLYQMLFIALTISLLLMVNRRLVAKLELDLVELRQVEAALKFSEEKFFKAFHSSPDSVTITRISDGRFVEVNEGFSRVTGYSREEALNSSITALQIWINPQDRESFLQTLQREQVVREAEYNYRTRSGEIRTGLLSVEIIQLGNEPHIVSVIHDITERKQAEDKLRASEERFRQLIMSAPDAVFGVDQEGKVMFANMEAINLLGYALDEFVGLDVEKLVPLKLREAHVVNRTKYMDTPRTRIMGTLPNMMAVHKDGSEIPVDIKLSPVEMEEGIQVVAFMRDVTEQKLAEERLRRQANQLAKIEEREQFARDLHDSVNQSIHSIMLFAETLVSLLTSERYREALEVTERIQQGGQHALKEIRLLLYKSQATQVDAQMDLLATLEERLNMVERRVGVKAQIIHQDHTLSHCPAEWRENLYWIVIEALNNALKHAQARHVTIHLHSADSYFELSVEDDGSGFDPLRARAGGFGMKSMRERAALLGGVLSVTSSPASGTRVHFKAKMEKPE